MPFDNLTESQFVESTFGQIQMAFDQLIFRSKGGRSKFFTETIFQENEPKPTKSNTIHRSPSPIY
jgi:hypothetical protein